MLEWPDDKNRASGLIQGPAGELQVDVDLPDATPRGLAVICHPHPQQGGTKDNKVVFMMARAATMAGLAAVRFNFRGVGQSEGAYDAGVGEVSAFAVDLESSAISAGTVVVAEVAGIEVEGESDSEVVGVSPSVEASDSVVASASAVAPVETDPGVESAADPELEEEIDGYVVYPTTAVAAVAVTEPAALAA